MFILRFDFRLGPQSDTTMAELYSAFDVFALASHREGFPRSAMEASAMSLPVVATDIVPNHW